MTRTRSLLTALAAVLLVPTSIPAGAAPHATPFEVGAASVDITPPPYTADSDAAFVPSCGTTPQQVAQLYPGKRLFAFEEPYVDLAGSGRWAPGDPYCDANADGRYDAPYVAGGSGGNRWPTAADPGNPLTAQAVVFVRGTQRVAMVSVDSIGLFNVTADAIRARARQLDPRLGDIHVSSTHNESAPDPIGLWGPDTTDILHSSPLPVGVTSGVDEYYMAFLAQRAGAAVAQADSNARPAALRLAVAPLPSNVQSCWSSYPYIDNQRIPLMQAVDSAGHVIMTLVNGQTHVETLAFSGVPAYITMFSGDWTGRLRAHLEERWPGSVAVELTGLIGSVETPTVYLPESTRVLDIPGQIHGVPGNPDGCSSVYPEPAGATPVRDAHDFLDAYGRSMADDVIATLATAAPATVPRTLHSQLRSVCVQLENQLFVAAFAARLFPDRPAYADPTCSAGASFSPAPAPPYHLAPGTAYPPSATWLKTDVGVLTVGPAQFAWSPAEVFPFTEIRGAVDPRTMPFPTDCYNSQTDDYWCGAPLPMTQFTVAQMTTPYRFNAGLGEDMIGYIFPPGNYVGTDQSETQENPWFSYQVAKGGTGHDRFGHGHSDDAESPGPHAGLAITQAISDLLGNEGHGNRVLPGMFVDAAGALSDSPFAGAAFGGATGVVVIDARGVTHGYTMGRNATSWATFDGARDPGTGGTSLQYSVSTAGIVLRDGTPLLLDVFSGAQRLVPGDRTLLTR
ncbi:MAG TPA: hypothetical protein VGQ42_13540 [Candidatus Dormibacteraeota bacterium]|jgi:hypothetical protein|nr:hypothetical protein [Candidatus Dormibacteraeota bacterium]